MHDTQSGSTDSVIALRPLQWPQDGARLQDFDASYSSTVIYEVEQDGLGFSLRELALQAPFLKNYPMDDIADDVRDADAAWVAEEKDGALVGLATVEYQEWNRSLLITGIFVAPTHKQKGIGHALLGLIDGFARTTPARCLQLETQNTNVPAIHFYLKQGFRLCGVNTDLYDPAQVQPKEAALYFTRELQRD
ncbi:streptothricin acetyltransferase [Janthinobacterium sp. Marseille]|nr:GNAT family N-acetyltransferase [Janthinobacterium sp. Marseille]ABR91351.1 streptothricin acetyltransferase [Janthinobacterium sp. Marseille]